MRNRLPILTLALLLASPLPARAWDADAHAAFAGTAPGDAPE